MSLGPLLTTWFALRREADGRDVIGSLRAAATRQLWADPGRWALRAGTLSPRLVQAESFEGAEVSLHLAELVLRHVRDVEVTQLCVPRRVAVGPAGPGLRLAWNYVVSSASHDLAAVADCLGGGVSFDSGLGFDGPQRVLCLPEPAPLQLADGGFAEVVMRDDPLGRLVYAFATADTHAPGRTTRHVLGLYTPEHRWVNMVTLTLDLQERPLERHGRVLLANGAQRNPVRRELAIGPGERLIADDEPPFSLLGRRWPL
jgi:hypothetical protein